MQVIKKILIKAILYPILLLLVLLGSVAISLQIPSVQTYLVNKVADNLSEALHFPIHVESVYIKWFDTLTLGGVSIKDGNNEPMITVGELDVDFALQSLLDTANINVDEATLHNAKVRLIKDKKTGDLNIDDFIAAINELTKSTDTTSTGSVPIFTIDRITLTNTLFSFDDKRRDSLRNQKFDYYHFTLDSLYLSADNFKVAADTIEFGVEKLRCVDRASKLRVHRMDTRFRYTKRSMSLDNLFASIGQSVIRKQLTFHYPNGPSDFNDFNNDIRMVSQLDSSIVNSHDLALFAPDLAGYDENWIISGDFSGKVTRFQVKNMDFYFGKSTHLKGNVSFDGLPNFKETFTKLDLRNSVVQASDLEQYVDKDSYALVKKFGRVALTGKFVGFPKDFVANGKFETALGNVVSDINLKITPKGAKSLYEGHLATNNFDLGRLVDEPELFQRIDMSGKVQGEGLTVKDAALKLVARVNRIGIYHYNYRNITINGDLRKEQFEGQIAIKDSNLIFNLAGEVDLKDDRNFFNVQGDLQRANLQALKLSSADISLQTTLNVQFEGIRVDDIVGEATFVNSTLGYQNRSLNIDSLYVNSSRDATERTFYLDSDLLTASAKGDFEFTNATADIQRLIHEYELYFMRSQKEQLAYYANKRTHAHNRYNIDYELQLKNVSPLLALFYPGIYVSTHTNLEGVFSNGNTSIFSFNSKIDTLFYKNYRFYGAEIDVTTSKLADSANVLAGAYIGSKKQQLGTFAPTENMVMEGIWNKDRIDFTGTLQQEKSTNRADLSGDLKFIPDGLQVHLQPSRFRILEDEWRFDVNNRITVIGQEVTFEQVRISNRDQAVSIQGALSNNPSHLAELKIENFSMATLTPVFNRKLQGTLNGFLNVKDVYNNLNVESEMNLEELVIDKFLVGNIYGESTWDNSVNKLNIDYQIERMGNQIMTLRGTYDPSNETNAFDLVANLDKTNLEILEPFTDGLVSELRGTASGTVRVAGTPLLPILKGEVDINRGRLRYTYLNTIINFEDKVFFNENEIGTRKMRLTDEEGNAAVLKGGVFHDGFRAFYLQLDAHLDNFKVLNTTIKEDEPYYGTAFATGDVAISGPIENLLIKARAKSMRGTRIYIPLDRSEAVTQQDYIRFVSKKKQQTDTSLVKNLVKSIKLTGVRLDFDFDITPDAYCELQFDKQTGDVIKANGRGTINMDIDTKGDFTMRGRYEIERGSYNFTFLNAVNKQFNINSNSAITWTGDPYSAILDINATYTQIASLYPIIVGSGVDTTQIKTTNTEYHRRYPAAVLLHLSGNLLFPEIKLGIEIKDYPQNTVFKEAVTSFQSRIQSNEQELSVQVFSLMILRQFSSLNSFTGGQGAIGNSVSELLSNQFSYWASQVDENLQIDFNVPGLDQQALNNFQLRLSYSFMNGRLRVTRNGSFTNSRNTTDTRSVVGEWTLEYWITTDGKFRLKMYNRNNQNPLATSFDENSITSTSAGFSLMHTQSFNTLGELFMPRKKKQPVQPVQEEEEKEEEPEKEQTTPPVTKTTGNLPKKDEEE